MVQLLGCLIALASLLSNRSHAQFDESGVVGFGSGGRYAHVGAARAPVEIPTSISIRLSVVLCYASRCIPTTLNFRQKPISVAIVFMAKSTLT